MTPGLLGQVHGPWRTFSGGHQLTLKDWLGDNRRALQKEDKTDVNSERRQSTTRHPQVTQHLQGSVSTGKGLGGAAVGTGPALLSQEICRDKRIPGGV